MASTGDVAIIAVDASPYSENAFDWYFGHMHKLNNKVILVHCKDFPSVPSRDTWDSQTKEGNEKADAVKDKFVNKLQLAGVSTPEFVMDFEKPGEMIVHVAEKYHANVIVMGTRGMGKLKRAFLGSVSNYVLNHAHCPVLVVRHGKEHE